jgi:ComF family protein
MTARWYERLSGILLDTVFPPNCARCGEPSDEPCLLCPACHDAIPWLPETTCPKCSAALGPHASGPRACSDCNAIRFRFDSVIAAMQYDGVARDLVRRLKFGRHPPAATPLGVLLADRVAADGCQVDVLVPVPLRWMRRLTRGFNQSALIAGIIGRRLGVPVARSVLARARGSLPQARMNGADRRRLPSGAFRVRRPATIRGRRVLLVDDVMTSGATAHRCAEALKAAGADRVFVAVAAR